MLTSPRRFFAVALAAGILSLQPTARLAAADGSGQTGHRAMLKPTSTTTPDIPFAEYEIQVEQDLLQLANQSREQAGAAKLALDPGLTMAARAHAQAMLDARRISHQFQGEPPLVQRLVATSTLQMEQAAENVALDYSAEGGHEHLMLSPPHRANLLNPSYNVVGLGVVRSGDRLYIVEDFARVLPKYSVEEVKLRIGAALNQMRRDAGRRALPRRDLTNADQAACSMAQADKLGTLPVRQLAERYTVLTYTSMSPETLPKEASHVIRSPNLRSFSIGACYARTQTYPTGVHWIVLSLD